MAPSEVVQKITLPAERAGLPTAELLLEDVGFVDQASDGMVTRLHTVRVEGITVGWYPG